MARTRDAMTLDLGGADVQRLQRAVDRVAAQRPAQRHTFAQPDRPRIGVDHVEAHDRSPSHQEPAVVGAEIDGGERVGETTAVPASLLPLFRREVPGHSELLFSSIRMVTEDGPRSEPGPPLCYPGTLANRVRHR